MYQKEKGNVQKKLSAIAMHIIDLCNPVAARMSRSFEDRPGGNNGNDHLIDHARFQLQVCNIDLNDDMRMVVLKMRDTIVILEMLRNCQLLSKEDILPIVIECNEVLDCLQQQTAVH